MEQLKSLKGADYKLLVSVDKETVEYQLYLKGDGNTDSPAVKTFTIAPKPMIEIN